MATFSENEIRSLLEKGKATVTFTKKGNGEVRIMECTLKEDLVPKTENKKVVPDGLVVAYDTNKSEWRSFYAQNVTALEEA